MAKSFREQWAIVRFLVLNASLSLIFQGEGVEGIFKGRCDLADGR